MNKKLVVIAASLLGCFSAVSMAVPVTYSFDTLTAIRMHGNSPLLSGVLRNTTSPVTISFVDVNSSPHIVSRCVPLFLTMIERPGKYYLSVIIDNAQFNIQLVSCDLELR